MHCNILPVNCVLLYCIVCVATLPCYVMANSNDVFNLEQTAAAVSAFILIKPLDGYTMFRSLTCCKSALWLQSSIPMVKPYATFIFDSFL